MLSEMDFKEQSHLFSLLAGIAYKDEKQATKEYKSHGFTQVKFVDVDSSQAYVIWNTKDLVICCRGTEPTEFKDIAADVRCFLVRPATGQKGRVHKGFKVSVDRIWPSITSTLKLKKQKVWVCGHSLGGAMACLIGNRFHEIEDLPLVEGVFTYGEPRSGNKKFVNHSLSVPHIRWVNGADIVPKVPPDILNRYKHHGDLHYMNHWGNVRTMTYWQAVKDQWRGFWKGIVRGKINFFINHSIDRYQTNLERYKDGDERPQV
jgi:triacylglycerol lipase